MKSQKQKHVNVYHHLHYYKMISDQIYSLFIFPDPLKCVLASLFQTCAGLDFVTVRCIAKWLDKKKDSNFVQQRYCVWSEHAEL